MKYIKSQMQQLIKENKELHTRFKELKAEHGLEKNNALKALYHSEVADGGVPGGLPSLGSAKK